MLHTIKLEVVKRHPPVTWIRTPYTSTYVIDRNGDIAAGGSIDLFGKVTRYYHHCNESYDSYPCIARIQSDDCGKGVVDTALHWDWWSEHSTAT